MKYRCHCCSQPFYTNVTKSFENDFLDGKMRFKFYDNSPGNDGSGEWVYGEFEKIYTINTVDLL